MESRSLSLADEAIVGCMFVVCMNFDWIRFPEGDKKRGNCGYIFVCFDQCLKIKTQEKILDEEK